MKTKAFVSDPFINQGMHWPCRSSSRPHCAVPQADRLPHASQRGGGVTPRKLAEAERGTHGPESRSLRPPPGSELLTAREEGLAGARPQGTRC